jgi:DNA-binding response OmpR family regulator
MGNAHSSFSGRQNGSNRRRACAFSLIGVEIQLTFRLRRYIRTGELDTTPTVKLLIIEDSQKLLKALTTGLRKLGNAVDACRDGEEGLKFALNAAHDIIVLDLMLPGLDGLSLLRSLRQRDNQTPVLILSARDRVEDRVRGLELGADDYLIKPFAFEELVARLATLQRRRYDQRAPTIEIGNLQLDIARHEVRCAGRVVDLTPRETNLLEYLALRRSAIVSVRQLDDHLFDSTKAVTRNAIEAHISGARKKLRAAGCTNVIKTRRGFGYYIE